MDDAKEHQTNSRGYQPGDSWLAQLLRAIWQKGNRESSGQCQLSPDAMGAKKVQEMQEQPGESLSVLTANS